MGDVLTVSDIARVRGTDHAAAYRWLQRNAAHFLRWRGKRLVIAAKDYAKLGAAPIDERVANRLARIEETLREHDGRLDAHAKALMNMHAL